MKIVKQKTLYFSEGKSDKVYEVDLCDSGSDLFVVNFRYGRRGANLREGTKTVFPVLYEEALSTFNSLIRSKENKGYRVESSSSLKNEKPSTIAMEVNVAREETIVKYLKDAVAEMYTRDWKISRVIWRASSLHIVKAIPYIYPFIDSEDTFEQYAAIYSLSKFKDTSSQNAIYKVFETQYFDDKVGRIAAAYILKFGTDSLKAKITKQAFDNLPEELNIHTDNTQAFFNALAIYFLREEEIDASVLYYTYVFSINDSLFRDALYAFIEKAPLKVNFFKSIRYIYRASDILKDVRFLALTSKRIAISKPGYTSSYLYVNNEWSSAEVEKQKKNPTIAFSKKTKDYFNKSIYKYVCEISKMDKVQYVDFAKALLVSLDDALDNVKEDIQYHYNYDDGQYNSEKRFFPKYHDFLGLMYIVYGNSTRIQNQGNKWFYLETDTSNLPREESFPELWNTQPAAVVYILANAKSEIAIQFGLRIIKDNRHFLENISDALIMKLVSHYHPKVLDMVLQIVEEKYTSTAPESPLLLALLKTNNERANVLAFQWLEQYEADYFSNPTFIEQLLLLGKENVMGYLKTLFAEKVMYEHAISLDVLSPLFKSPSTYTTEYLILVNDLIGNTYFGKLLSTVSEEKIKELANSSVVINKLFAANLAKQNTIPTYSLFKNSIDGYINADSAELRKVGIELLSHFPDSFLLENHHQISAFCFSEYHEVREAIQPTVEKLIKLDENFKNNLFKALLGAIETTETYEGLHNNCYQLLTTNYKQYLNSISQADIFRLILSKFNYAQELGEPLFKEHVDIETLSVKEMVQLANSDIFSIRNILRTYFENNVPRINYELEDALLIFNSNWEDIINWACTYFEEHIKSENWTVNMLLYACDHTKTEVQHFGRKMITQHFSEEKGLPLLLKLQEHPTKAMQFFVTNYLDNYAKDKEEVILKLESYFKTTLFNINENRVAKTRIYTFLEQESIKNKSVARMTTRLIESVLRTNIIVDTSNNIDLLLTIVETHPDIEIPLLIKQN